MTDSPSSAAATSTLPADASSEPSELGASSDSGTSPITGPLLPAEREALHAPRQAAATVTAVIVSRNGERWLPALTKSLRESTRPADRLVGVDVGSTDRSRALLEEACSAVVPVSDAIGFGTAVQAAVAETPAADDGAAEEWLWLLHDDCRPSPDALAALLQVASTDQRIAAVGGRLRAWPRARRLLEVGVTITGTGHREPGVELGEFDQGQHSRSRDVLAVSSAGMLVRRRVWEEMGGFDPELPLFRDDVDFGWRAARAGYRIVVAPSAVLFHVEAAARDVRPLTTRRGRRLRPHRLDRRAAVFVLLANCRTAAVIPQYLRLWLGSLLRALGYLLGKLPTAAVDEIAGTAAVLARPWRVAAARRRRRRTARVPAAAVRHLLPPWWTPYRNGWELLAGRVAERVRPDGAPSEPSGSALADEEALTDDRHRLGVLRHPLAALAVACLVGGALASRGLWGSGLLQGGALLPAPVSPRAWQQLYVESWHPVALGSQAAPSPYVVALAGLGAVLLGKAWLAVDVLVLFAVPLCALGAYAGSRRLVAGRSARLWLAATYATLPVVTGAVPAGRLGTTVVAIGLPWLLAAVSPLLTSRAPGTWVRAAAATAFVLALLTAFAPLLWPMSAAAGAVGAVWCAVTRRRGQAVALVAAMAAPAALLLPWTARLLERPATFLTEAGRPVALTGSDPRWQTVLGRIGAPDDAPWWLSLGIAVVAVLALLRSDRRTPVAAAWLVVAVALGTAAAVADRTVAVAGTAERVPVWLGVPILLALGAGLLAAAVAADGLVAAVRSGRFGWRQPLAAAAAVVGIVTSVGAFGWWVATAPRGDLTRTVATPLPAYMSDAMTSEAAQRVLVLDTTGDVVRYRLLAGDGVRLGDETVTPAEDPGLRDLVADLLSAARPGDVERLADYGVAYVVLTSSQDAETAAALDALPRLTRASTDAGRLLGWQVDLPTGYARLLDPRRRDAAATAQVLSSDGVQVSTGLPAGPASRVLALATTAGDGLRASVAGRALDRADAPVGAAFAVGEAPGTLHVDVRDNRRRLLVLQLALWAVALVLAAPALDGRRSGRTR